MHALTKESEIKYHKLKQKILNWNLLVHPLEIEDFIQNYYSFFAMLIRANIRDLKLNTNQIYSKVRFYQGMGVNELIIQQLVVVSFLLILNVVGMKIRINYIEQSINKFRDVDI